MAAVSMLEKRINKHMKDSSDQIKYLKSELECLKTFPKPKAQRTNTELSKTKETPKNKRVEQIVKISAKLMKGNEKSSDDMKTSKKPVKC